MANLGLQWALVTVPILVFPAEKGERYEVGGVDLREMAL